MNSMFSGASEQAQDEGAIQQTISGGTIAPLPVSEGVYSVNPANMQDNRVLGSAVLGGVLGVPPPVLPSELPPQAFLTSAMLLDLVDKKIILVLRDDKTYVGVLRSYDQWGNVVLLDVVERLFVKNPDAEKATSAQPWLYADSPFDGILFVRGENVAVAAAVDLDQEDKLKHCTLASANQVRALYNQQLAEKRAKTLQKNQARRRLGLEPDYGWEG